MNERTKLSKKQCIDNDKYGCTHTDWLSAGDIRANGTVVEDHSDVITCDDMQKATNLLEARETIRECIDSHIRNDVRIPYMWYSGQDESFITEFTPVEEMPCIRSDYVRLSSILEILSSIVEMDLVSECPLPSVRKLTSCLHDAMVELSDVLRRYNGSDALEEYELYNGRPWYLIIGMEGGYPESEVVHITDNDIDDTDVYDFLFGIADYEESMFVLGPYLTEDRARSDEMHYLDLISPGDDVCTIMGHMMDLPPGVKVAVVTRGAS